MTGVEVCEGGGERVRVVWCEEGGERAGILVGVSGGSEVVCRLRGEEERGGGGEVSLIPLPIRSNKLGPPCFDAFTVRLLLGRLLTVVEAACLFCSALLTVFLAPSCITSTGWV